MKTHLRYHVFEITIRDGKTVYVHVKTYRRWAWLNKFLIRYGKPVWYFYDLSDSVNTKSVGGYVAFYYDAASGKQWGRMPEFPLYRGK